MGNPKGHLKQLDGLRAALAIFVVAHHAYITIYPYVPGHQSLHGWAKVSGLMYLGTFAVDWFIVLSGFCLMLPVLKRTGDQKYTLARGAPNFYMRRARRILPTFYAALGLSLILCWTVVGKMTGTHWDVSLPVTKVSILANLLLVQDIVQEGRINHAFWSIAVEWRIYFLFPLILWLWRKIGGVLATLSVAAICIACIIGLPHLWTKFDVLQLTLSYTVLFGVGALAAACSVDVSIKPQPEWQRVLIIIASGVLVVFAVGVHLHYVPKFFNHEPFEDISFGVAAAALVFVWTTPGRSVARAILSSPPLTAVGVFAYSIYLTHAPLVQIAWQLFIRPNSLHGASVVVVLEATATAMSIGVGYLFFLAFERPFLSSKQRVAAQTELPGFRTDEISFAVSSHLKPSIENPSI